MKFSKTFTNKLVSYVDRYYTYDSRKMKREGTITDFDFVAFNHETNTSVFIKRGKYGIWASIRKESKHIQSGYLKTYTEVSNFKKMVCCLG